MKQELWDVFILHCKNIKQQSPLKYREPRIMTCVLSKLHKIREQSLLRHREPRIMRRVQSTLLKTSGNKVYCNAVNQGLWCVFTPYCRNIRDQRLSGSSVHGNTMDRRLDWRFSPLKYRELRISKLIQHVLLNTHTHFTADLVHFHIMNQELWGVFSVHCRNIFDQR